MTSKDIVFESCFEDLSPFFLDCFYKEIATKAIRLNSNDGEKIVSTGYLFDISVKGLNGYYLYGLATLPEYRGQGRMKKLLNEAQEMAIKNGKNLLYLATNNCKAEKLYRNFGFKKVVFPFKKPQDFSERVNFEDCSLKEYFKNTLPSIKLSENLRFSMLESVSEDLSAYKTKNGYILLDKAEMVVYDFYPKTKDFVNTIYSSLENVRFFFDEYSFLVKPLDDNLDFCEFSYILH